MIETDGRRLRGERSRGTVMRAAMDFASLEGLESLSLGSLATAANLSKSGVVALFGSKEQLQLATIDAAADVFIDVVVAPALRVAGGRARLDAMLENWIIYSQSRVFAGGCFFAATSLAVASKPGPVRDSVADHLAQWNDALSRVIDRAVDRGELQPIAETAQLVFEIRAILDAANTDSLLFRSSAPYDRARVALSRLLP
jgi:AcrR family transcriptional regulator